MKSELQKKNRRLSVVVLLMSLFAAADKGDSVGEILRQFLAVATGV